MKGILLQSIGALAMLFMASGAQAALITFNFTTVITQLGQVNSYGGTSIGDTFSGSFTFDDTVAGSGGVYAFSGPGVGISATVGSSSFDISQFTITVSNQIGSGSTNDVYLVEGAEGSAQSDTYFKIVLTDTDGLIFSDQSLPLTPPPLSAIEAQGNVVRTQTPTTTNPFSAFDLTSLTVATVPIPAAAWLFGSAIGLLGWMRRKAA